MYYMGVESFAFLLFNKMSGNEINSMTIHTVRSRTYSIKVRSGFLPFEKGLYVVSTCTTNISINDVRQFSS